MSSPISGHPAYSTYHSDDLVLVLDVHDTSLAPTGTTKKARFNQLTFVGAGVGHITGLVPDPGSSAHANPYLLGDNASFIQITGALVTFGSNTYTFALPSTGLVITQHSSVVGVATDGATVTFNFALFDRYKITITGNRTFVFSGAVADQVCVIEVIQGGSGSNIPVWPGSVDWGTAGAPTLSTTVGKSDIFVFYYNGTTFRASTVGLGF